MQAAERNSHLSFLQQDSRYHQTRHLLHLSSLQNSVFLKLLIFKCSQSYPCRGSTFQSADLVKSKNQLSYIIEWLVKLLGFDYIIRRVK